jgi:hypothetical protein
VSGEHQNWKDGFEIRNKALISSHTSLKNLSISRTKERLLNNVYGKNEHIKRAI